MWYKNVGTSFFRFVAMHAFDRQTDGQKGLGNTVRCITYSGAVKIDSNKITVRTLKM